MASGARSKAPGQVTAPYSTNTCSKNFRSRRQANTPAVGESINAAMSTVPSVPSRNPTASRKPAKALTHATDQGLEETICGVISAARSALSADPWCIAPNPPIARNGDPRPIPAQVPAPAGASRPLGSAKIECQSKPHARHKTHENAAAHDPTRTSGSKCQKTCLPWAFPKLA